MCGISGIFSNKMDGNTRRRTVENMAMIQRHRGPNDTGLYEDGDITLGHNRLSIIDLQHGKQPIFNEDGALIVVYNGEIYNFKELKGELQQKGHMFSTNTDTEVIVHSFEEWGEGAVEKFNGMFVFALWDKKNRTLYIVRDRLGIKPVYLYNKDGVLAFVSEVKAFCSIPGFNLKTDKRGIYQYLCFQNYYGKERFYKDIELVEPGCVYKFDDELKLTITKYYSPRFQPDYTNSFDDWAGKLELTINKSVKRHLVSEVPLGAYLSGGFDSSLVSWFAQQNISPARLSTFNGYFAEGGDYDESALALDASKSIGSEHNRILITSDDFKNEFDRLIYHLEEPMMGPGSFSQYIVAREIAKKVTVVLTGHGGDEFFAGYPAYKAALFRENVFANFCEIFGNLTAPDLVRLAYFLVFPVFRPMLRTGLHVLFTPAEISRLLNKEYGAGDVGETLKDKLSGFMGTDTAPTENIMLNYIKGYLSGLFLVEDKISMAHSVESRTPLCDNEMLELSLSIPAKQKLRNGNLKALFKHIARNKLPESLYNKPKRGFPTPIHLWFKGQLKGWVEERLFDNDDELFDNVQMAKLWDNFNAVKGDNLYTYNFGCKIFSVLCLKAQIRQKYNNKAISVA